MNHVTDSKAPQSGASSYPAPQCEHWILGDISVVEKRGPRYGDAEAVNVHRYERAILVTFKTLDEYRAALKYMDPIFSGDESSSDSAPGGAR